MLAFFGLTIFVSATLLFLVQPMFAKMVLPLLGGTPGVWNTCMVFFQATLLAGYAYSHVSTRLLGVRRQAALHVFLLLLPLLVLPITVASGWSPPADSTPAFWLLGLLTVSVGLPFFVVSSTNPLLQRWLTETGHPAGKDPYFLYGASNLGSMLALLGYPTVMETLLRLDQQSWLWAGGYGLLVFLEIGCAILLWRSAPGQEPSLPLGPSETPAKGLDDRDLTFGRRLHWVALAFVPSSLMLGVTTYLTTDLASVPLFWVIPLALYLLTFILVFSRRPILRHAWMLRLLPWLVLPLALAMVSMPKKAGLWPLFALHLATFFVASMACHGELAERRPTPRHLTEYYLLMSLGGVLGGMFNALLAPVIFTRIAEYPLAIMFSCLLLPARNGNKNGRWPASLDLALPALLAIVLVALIWAVPHGRQELSIVTKLLLFGVPAMICFAFVERPVRFGLGIGVLLMAGSIETAFHDEVLHAQRSFFGVHRVILDPTGRFVQLEHGTTIHGGQFRDPARQLEPVAYYHRTGPVGDVFRAFSGPKAKAEVAIIGLGSGGLAAYLQPGQRFVFYEIDPVVKAIAENPRYFTFLSSHRGQYEIVLGDGRLKLAEAPSSCFGMIVIDAFSSDAIPVHLLTREALAMYMDKLAEDGLLLFNISNRFLDLSKVLDGLAADAGLVCYSRPDLGQLTEQERLDGKTPSHFVVMARRCEDLGGLAKDADWHALTGRFGAIPWTDDFSNLLSVLK